MATTYLPALLCFLFFQSAKDISNQEWVGPQGGTGTCSSNSGNMLIGNLGCTGPGSCAYNTEQVTAGQRACLGEVSCCYNNGAAVDAMDDACKGDGSCSNNGLAAATPSNETEPMTIWAQKGSCGGAGSCRNGQGNADLSGCSGDNSCDGWQVPYNPGRANDLTLGDIVFSVASGACAGAQSCHNLQAGGTGISIGENSCTGANACHDILTGDLNLMIGSNACTADNACQGCTLNVIPDGAADCDGSSGGGSGGGGGGGDGGSGSSSAISNHPLFGNVLAIFMLVVGYLTL